LIFQKVSCKWVTILLTLFVNWLNYLPQTHST